PDAGTCTYDCTLYPLNATNTGGMSGWTIIKRPHTTAIDNTGWIFNGNCAASTATVVSRTGMTNFSFLAVDQTLSPLPISLVYFDGYSQDNINILNWETSSERDNDYFTIEKSADGINFSEMKKVDGAGTSNSKIVYETTDYSPFNGLTYYRLGQTDFDGVSMHFKTISIANSNSEFKLSDIHPNPTTGNINLDIEAPHNGIVTYTIFDNTGRVILTQAVNVSKGENSVAIDLSNAAKGSYVIEVKLMNTDIKQIEKIIKQ
ncbi:MAG: T9SS type A sorting domain-containing protein, partial [Flavobacteriia bacterium]